jgi:ankyrin repeat protein
MQPTPDINLNLISAAIEGNDEAVLSLIDKGADIDIKSDRTGQTPLMAAATYGHLTILNVLIEMGVDLNAKSKNGSTALMLAAAEGHTEIVITLLDKGADSNIKNTHGETALILAANDHHTDVVNLLNQTH